MQSVTAIFHELEPALSAMVRLRAIVPQERLNLLTPASSHEELFSIPHEESMPPVAKKMGAILGGALGAGVAVSLLPGVGVIAALGAGVAALLGAGGGGAVGWLVGSAVDRHDTHGVPIDELYFYEDALRKDHTVLVALVDGEHEADAVRAILDEEGAESLDRARESWWLGLRDAERLAFTEEDAEALAWDEFEHAYRMGFEAGHSVRLRGLSYDAARAHLAETYPQVFGSVAFRRGYESGRRHFEEERLAREHRRR